MAFTQLDELRIEDPIIRSYLRRDILAKSEEFSSDDVISREVYVDEEYRPDLLAYRVFGTESLRWLPGLVAHTDGEINPLPVGSTLRLPSSAWISERIRHYTDSADLDTDVEITRRG